MKTKEDRYSKLGKAILEEYLVQGSKKIEVVLTPRLDGLSVSVDEQPIISLTEKEIHDKIEKMTVISECHHNARFVGER